jgi:hypothetical protein
VAKGSTPGFTEVWKYKREAQLRHVLARRLPPSCLHCGHRQVSFFTEGKWAPHPGTGEEVRFSCTGMCSTDFAMKFYDIDGNLLELSDKEINALRELNRKGKDL